MPRCLRKFRDISRHRDSRRRINCNKSWYIIKSMKDIIAVSDRILTNVDLITDLLASISGNSEYNRPKDIL